MTEEAVRVSIKKSRRDDREYVSYSIALPKRFADELGIRGGDILHARIVEIEIDGKKVKGILYYKP